MEQQKSIVSQLINTKHKRHKSLRDSVEKLSLSIASLHQQNKDNNNKNINNSQSHYSHTKTHSDSANINCKK